MWRTLTNRYKRMETPEMAKPKGGLARAEAIKRYRQSRAETTNFVGGTARAAKGIHVGALSVWHGQLLPLAPNIWRCTTNGTTSKSSK